MSIEKETIEKSSLDRKSLEAKLNELIVLTSDFCDEKDRGSVALMRERLASAIIKDDLLGNDGIKFFLEWLQKQVVDINEILQEKEDLPDEERKILWARKRWNREVLSFFLDAKKEIKSINSSVSENIKHLKNQVE